MTRKTIISMMFLILTVSFGQVGLKMAKGAFSVPKLLNYQGYLTDNQGNPINNPSLSMTFSIYDASSVGNLKWTEDQNVKVEKGIFNVTLGTVAPIPDTVFTGGIDRWLELIAGGQTLTPRTRIAAMGYAYTATYSDTAQYAKNAVADNDWTIAGSNMYSGVSGDVGIGIATPRAKLETMYRNRLSANTADRSFCHEEVKEIVSLTGWTTVKTITAGGVMDENAGIVEAYLMANTGIDSNGCRVSRWYFDYTNGTVSVGVVGTDETALFAPGFRLMPSGTNILVQVGGYGGGLLYRGTALLRFYMPRNRMGTNTYTID